MSGIVNNYSHTGTENSVKYHHNSMKKEKRNRKCTVFFFYKFLHSFVILKNLFSSFPNFPSFLHSFIHYSFILWFINPFICYLFVCSCHLSLIFRIHSFIHSFAHSLFIILPPDIMIANENPILTVDLLFQSSFMLRRIWHSASCSLLAANC